MIPNAEMVTTLGRERDRETGQWRQVDIGIIDNRGRSARFRLRGKQASNASLRRLRDRFRDLGVTFIGGRSLDVFQGISQA